MRGEGKRRLSLEELPVGAVAGPVTAPPAHGQLRNGGIRRKPVPSVVMEGAGSPTKRQSRISPTQARSSVAQDIDREKDAPTPGVDDTPYIHFALDQLTRDEEVRGSRRYPGIAPGLDGSYPYNASKNAHWPTTIQNQKQYRYEEVPQEEKYDEKQQDLGERIPPPRNPDRIGQSIGYPQAAHVGPQGPNNFIPVIQQDSRQPLLNYLPSILRPLMLGLFFLLVLIYLACLIFTAIWSRINIGLTPYGSFGDGKYFLWQYLPPLIGMILLVWLFQVVTAVYRIAPFIAMGPSSTPPSRIAGAKLPLQPKSLALPYFGHFGARLPVIGAFVLIAWLQVFTIPLLGSCFNVYQDSSAMWHWIATQGAIWTVIVLYVLLALALIVLLLSLKRSSTSLKWDPKSLADLIVLLERSNALDGEGETAPQIGYWRTSHRPNEVFHAYGIADKPARSYGLEDGRIREKRYSDPDMDLEAGQPPRQSKEAMLPRDQDSESEPRKASALPWFLKPFFALLWPIVALVLLLAFLIVSYLPSTTVSAGFDPLVPSAVDRLGFSGANFLYSFVPALLATFVFLGWLDFDLAHSRLTPFESLTSINNIGASTSWMDDLTGDVAERTLLPSYAADLPFLRTLSALFNKHYRMAFISAVTLLNIAIPILASGIFWSEFSIQRQIVRISAHMPAYYALTVFITINALGYLAIFPSSTLRHAPLPRNLNSFAGIRDCVTQSRLLDDFAFRNPASKTDLVTRLLSASHAHQFVYPPPTIRSNAAAAESKVSLADSVRGFGRARAQAQQQPLPSPPVGGGAAGGQAKYAFSRFEGRDGREGLGLDRVRLSR